MSATLHVIEGPDEGRLFTLGDSVVTIGRNAENTIVLNDVAVSGVHTKIVKKANGRYTLLDSASTNGTFVNGAEQRAIDLKHGDQIRIGGCTLAFEEHRGSGILQAGSGEGAIKAERRARARDLFVGLPNPATLDREALEQAFYRSQLLERLDRVLAECEGSTEALQAVLEAAMAGAEATRGFVLLVDGKSGEILPSVAEDRSGRSEEIPFSKSIALEVVGSRKGLVRLHDDRSVVCAPIGGNGSVSGVVYLDFPSAGAFTPIGLDVVECVGRRAGSWIETTNSKVDFDLLFSSMIDAIMKSIQAKDVYTRGHSERVRHYSKLLGKELGLSPDELYRVSLGAGLHDIGKIGMPDEVLKHNKNPRLTEEQLNEVKKHPVRGAQILGDIPFLQDIVPAAELHHEDWDGTGYPHGLAGEDIPLIARIVAVADTYDAITTDRPYQKGKSYEEGHEILRAIAGKRLEPELVEAFVSAFKKYRKVPISQTRSIKKPTTRVEFEVKKALAESQAANQQKPDGDDLDEGLKSVILIG